MSFKKISERNFCSYFSHSFLNTVGHIVVRKLLITILVVITIWIHLTGGLLVKRDLGTNKSDIHLTGVYGIDEWDVPLILKSIGPLSIVLSGNDTFVSGIPTRYNSTSLRKMKRSSFLLFLKYFHSQSHKRTQRFHWFPLYSLFRLNSFTKTFLYSFSSLTLILVCPTNIQIYFPFLRLI